MQRRTFNRSLTALGFLGSMGFQSLSSMAIKTRKAPRLKIGDTVGLIAPASPFRTGQLEKAIRNLEALGLKVTLGQSLQKKKGYLAGTDKERLADLHAFFADKAVHAIWCIRGGYGTPRLLPQVDYDLIKKNPKVLIGYSDITALIQAIYIKTGLITFHGPVGASDFTDYEVAHLKAILFDGIPNHMISNPRGYTPFYTINKGIAEGEFLGGNLSLIAALAGTDYEWSVKNKILFLEDVGEKPYRIDRMLTQLRQNCPLGKAAGIMLGTFADCDTNDPEKSWTLKQVLEDRLGDLNIPVAYGMCFGHIKEQFTIPIGLKARFDAEEGSLKLLESAVK